MKKLDPIAFTNGLLQVLALADLLWWEGLNLRREIHTGRQLGLYHCWSHKRAANIRNALQFLTPPQKAYCLKVLRNAVRAERESEKRRHGLNQVWRKETA